MLMELGSTLAKLGKSEMKWVAQRRISWSTRPVGGLVGAGAIVGANVGGGGVVGSQVHKILGFKVVVSHGQWNG